MKGELADAINVSTRVYETHRLGGKLMFFGSLLLLILEFFVSAGVFAFLFVSFMLLLVLWSFLYSWHHFRTHNVTREML
jgi:hypothetical protein